MKVTLDLLKTYNAPASILSFFHEEYPEGAHIKDILLNENISMEELNWFFTRLDLSDEEISLYENRLGISNVIGYFDIRDSKNSERVAFSDNIDNSIDIISSSYVKNSAWVYSSSDIENCKSIFRSSFCFDSSRVLSSSNITNSREIFSSKYIINCNSVSLSSFIEDSTCIRDSENIDNSHFLSKCKNMKNSLFCFGIEGRSLYLFNKPISEKNFKNISAQFEKIIGLPLPMLKGINTNNPTFNYSISKIYSDLPKKFWDWVKTLPNYDESILYSLTLQNFLNP